MCVRHHDDTSFIQRLGAHPIPTTIRVYQVHELIPISALYSYCGSIVSWHVHRNPEIVAFVVGGGS